MEEVKSNVGKLTRQEFIYELMSIRRNHSLTLNQVMILYSYMYKIEWEKSPSELLVLYQKGLLKPGNEVDIEKLFDGRNYAQQLEIDFNFSTEPKCTPETLSLAHKLEEEFVIDKYRTESHVKMIADSYFKGDLSLARYFIIFDSLFPRKNASGSNNKWNSHFGFAYEGVSRRDSSSVVLRKFAEVYKKKDIGIFLSGLYYYIKDTINFDTGECYCVKPNKFLEMYQEWYDIANEKFLAKKFFKQS